MNRFKIRSFISLIVASVAFAAICVVRSSTAASVKTPLTVFSNTQPITINTASGLVAPTTAAVYPATINVTGMTGNTTKVEVSLRGIAHTVGQLDLLLVSPSGGKFIFLSDSNAVTTNDGFYTFSDTGATTLLQPNNTLPGTFLPTDLNTGTDTFPAPAPAGPYSVPVSSTFASVFNGTSPNGAWTLYAVDDTLFASGRINSGWSLNITTDGAPQTFTDLNTISFNDIVTPASPYASVINVAGQSGVVTSLKVSLTGFSHAAPADVDIILVSPNGKSTVVMTDVTSSSVSNINLTFDDAAANTINVNPIVSGTYRPTDNFGDIDFYPNPAPPPPNQNYGLSSFNGFSPNGEWRLFVVDDTQLNAGSIAGGWSLDITTGPQPPQPPLSCSGPSFSPASFPTGAGPTNFVLADLNNDGKTDVAVTNQVSNDVSILLGNGNGTFAPQTLVMAGSGPYAIASGLFNADSNIDLAVVNSTSNNVSILLGNGSGGFSAPVNFFVGTSPISIAVADLNNDGKQDLAVANFGGFFSGSVSLLLGNGTGGFTTGTQVRTRTQPSYVIAANINGDGNQDLIVANFGANSVSTFSGNGAGAFQLIQNLTSSSGPVALEYANFIGDSAPDLAIANYNSDTVTTYVGSSNGTFFSGSTNSVGQNPISVTTGDYVGNGTRSFATALSGANAVNLSSSFINVGLNPNAVDTVDINGDGRPDMITANSGSNDISVLVNGCSAATGNIFDYNGDRKTDYSVFRPSNSAYYIQGLSTSTAVAFFGRSNDIQVPADYDGDRLTDIGFYRPENGLWFILDRFSRPISFFQFGLAGDIAVPADYDGDGKADITVFRPSTGDWYIRRSSDNSMQTIHFGGAGDKPVAADFDGDSRSDLAIFRPSNGVWYILQSSNGEAVIRQFGTAEDKTVVGDYDGDGKADIAVWRPSTAVWYILRSSDGGFNAVAWGFSTDIPVVGDFEGDGKYDYAVWRPSDRVWYILKSSDNGGAGFQWGLAGDTILPNSYVR